MKPLLHASLTTCCALLLAACGGSGPEVITGEFEGRDCEIFTVDENWLVYVWSPPVPLARPLHLVARHLATGEETELEADWRGGSGGLDLDGGNLVYMHNAPGEGVFELLLLNLVSGSSRSLATGRLSAPRISGSNITWYAYDDAGGRRIAVATVQSGFLSFITDPEQAPIPTDSRPRISGNDIVFRRMDNSVRAPTLHHHNLSTGITQKLPIESISANAYDVSDGKVVYIRTGEDVFHIMDLATRTERYLTDAPRWIGTGGPVIRGNLVAWIRHIPREEFKSVAGQPLIDERHFRTLYVMNIDTGKVITPMQNSFGILRPRIASDRHIYVQVPRVVAAGSAEITDVVRF